MAKSIATNENRRLAKAIKRNAFPKQFVLGRKAFARISAVEGIFPSKSLSADLKRLEHVPASERRQALTAKYGKK